MVGISSGRGPLLDWRTAKRLLSSSLSGVEVVATLKDEHSNAPQVVLIARKTQARLAAKADLSEILAGLDAYLGVIEFDQDGRVTG